MGARRIAPALLAVTSLCCACDDRRPQPSPPAATALDPSGVAATLGLDAGLLETSDPPAPAGDLSRELEQFAGLESCVAQRAALDPLLGDALRAIGYDTFVRDACRLLEAAKSRRRDTCDRIDASSLRATCRAWVAMLAQDASACPLLFEGLPSRGRAPTCVAVAARDPRLCAAEARAPLRATCEALTQRDEARCDGLAPADRTSCKRELSRWRALLPAPLDGLPRLPEAHGELTVRGEAGTPDPRTPAADLLPDLVRGAVVVTTRGRARVELGALGESDSARIVGAPVKRMRVGVAVAMAPPRGGASAGAGRETGAATLERLELEVPGELPVVVPPGKCECKVTRARVDEARGGDIALAIEGTVTGAGKTYRIALEATTFARDVVVVDTLGGGALPTLRPRP